MTANIGKIASLVVILITALITSTMLVETASSVSANDKTKITSTIKPTFVIEAPGDFVLGGTLGLDPDDTSGASEHNSAEKTIIAKSNYDDGWMLQIEGSIDGFMKASGNTVMKNAVKVAVGSESPIDLTDTAQVIKNGTRGKTEVDIKFMQPATWDDEPKNDYEIEVTIKGSIVA